MIFNFWRPFPFIPPKEGRYLCCLDNGMVIDLYFRYDGKWIDTRRQNVFDGYKCYKAGREPLEYNRIFEDSLCVRENVVAWKAIPRQSIWSHKKKSYENSEVWEDMDGR